MQAIRGVKVTLTEVLFELFIFQDRLISVAHIWKKLELQGKYKIHHKFNPSETFAHLENVCRYADKRS